MLMRFLFAVNVFFGVLNVLIDNHPFFAAMSLGAAAFCWPSEKS